MPSELKALIERFSILANRSHALPTAVASDNITLFAEPQAFYAWAVSALNALRAAFGKEAPHCKAFEAHLEMVRGKTISEDRLDAIRGIFLGGKDDLDGGHLYDVERTVVGEVVGDFLALAKLALSEGHHAVAAVLASAALEDALKRYAGRHGLKVTNKTMDEIVNALKSQGLVSGPQKSLLGAMPKLRNQAMHAHWEAITPQDAGSMIGFTEQFLLVNFS